MEAAGHGGVPLAVELGSTEAGVAGWFCTYSHRLTGTDSSWIRRSRPNDGSGVVGLGSSWSPLSGCIDAFSHNQRWHPVPQITSACHQSILIHLLFMIAHIGSFFYNYWFLQSTQHLFATLYAMYFLNNKSLLSTICIYQPLCALIFQNMQYQF